MFNINKKVLKQLRRLAAELPEVNRITSMDKKLITGKEALLTGLTPPEGEKFVPEQEYLMNVPTYALVNHLLRLKKAYRKHGGTGAIGYCEKIYTQTEQ